MVKIIDIIAIIIILLIIIGMAMMPWPANVILGSIASLSFIVAFISSRQAKRKEQDTNQNEKTGR